MIPMIARWSGSSHHRSEWFASHHGRWPLPLAPWWSAPHTSRASLEGPKGTIGRFASNTSLQECKVFLNGVWIASSKTTIRLWKTIVLFGSRSRDMEHLDIVLSSLVGSFFHLSEAFWRCRVGRGMGLARGWKRPKVYIQAPARQSPIA